MNYKGNAARFADTIGVDEAEAFLAWLHQHPKPRLDLSTCTHMHAAQLQVLMAARLPIAKCPADAAFSAWLEAALRPDR